MTNHPQHPTSDSARGQEPLVRVRDVDFCFGDHENRNQVLFNVHLTMMPGTITVLTGPSGSGKTTLLSLIGCLRSVQTGDIQLLGRELKGLSTSHLTDLRRRLGFIFQTHNLLESLTAQQNVRMAQSLAPSSRSIKTDRCAEILTRLGLHDRLHYKTQQLSVGQRQRVAIARALVTRPRVVLADEPTASLDRRTAQNVIQLLKETTAGEGSCVLIVTHDDRVLEQADHVVHLIDGRIAADQVANDSQQAR